MKKQTIVIIALSVALVISVTANIALCVCWPSSSTTPDDETPIIRDMLEIETPYGTLLYPEKYRAALQHEGTQTDTVYTHAFSIQGPQGPLELFSIHFGDSERGTLIGYVDMQGMQTAVTVTSTSYSPDDTWTEAETEQFNAMLMAVNDVIASVQAWDIYLG